MPNITWSGKDVFMDDKLLIAMPDNVVKALACDDKIIILTLQDYIQQGKWTKFREPPLDDEIRTRNLIAVDQQGQLIWRASIAPLPADTFYANLWIENDELHGYLNSGWDVRLNPTTGEILEKKFMK